MTSLMTSLVILSLFCALMTQCRGEDLVTSFTDFRTFYDGDYDNSHATDKDGNLDRIRAIFKSALIPALQKEPVVYLEESINGKPYRRCVTVKVENPTGGDSYAVYYNFTTPGNYEPGTFNTDDLANLTADDFKIKEGCPVFFQKLSPTSIIADWSDCRHTVSGQRPTYSATVTCDRIIVESPLAADEVSALAPYHLIRRGPRFPLIDLPEGYVNPCPEDP